MDVRRLIASAIGVCLVLAGLVACGSGGTRPAAAGSSTAAETATTVDTAPAVVSPTAPGASAHPAVPTTVAQSSATTGVPQAATLAGRIRPGVAYQGVATAYEAGNGDGACLFGPAADMMIAAMNVADYDTAKACGDTILINAANGKSITVRITNECPAPCAPGQIDLSQQAFAKLADLKVGRLSITWTLVSPPGADPISIRYKAGSSKWWCGIQVIGHRNPVARLEVRAGSGWRQLPRTDYNYFISADGSGCGGQLRITDIYGQQLVLSGITLSPDVAQRTTAQFAHH